MDITNNSAYGDNLKHVSTFEDPHICIWISLGKSLKMLDTGKIVDNALILELE